MSRSLQLFTCDALGPYEPSGKSVSDFHLDHEEWPGQTYAVAPGWGVFAMIKRVFAVSIAAALGLATLPVEVSAKGFGSHASHAVGPTFFKGSPVRHHHRAFGYGGLIAAYTPGDAPLPVQIGAVTTSPSCTHSRETITVPSEEGGTRQITITRC